MITTKTYRCDELQTTIRGWVEQKRKGEDNIFYARDVVSHVAKNAADNEYLPKIPALANFRFDQAESKSQSVISLLGVFDGHLGKFASTFASGTCAFHLFALDEFRAGHYEAALKKLPVFIHNSLRSYPDYRYEDDAQSASGTTASFALITPEYTYFASVGDSPIVVFDKRSTHPIYHLGACHNRQNPECRQIILESGMSMGTISPSSLSSTPLAQLSGFYPYPSAHDPLPHYDRPLPPYTVLGSGLSVFGGIGDAWSDTVVYNAILQLLKIFCKRRSHRLDKYLSASLSLLTSGTGGTSTSIHPSTSSTSSTATTLSEGIAAKFVKFFVEEYSSADRELIGRILNIPKLTENKYFYYLLLSVAKATLSEEEHLQKYYGGSRAGKRNSRSGSRTGGGTRSRKMSKSHSMPHRPPLPPQQQSGRGSGTGNGSIGGERKDRERSRPMTDTITPLSRPSTSISAMAIEDRWDGKQERYDNHHHHYNNNSDNNGISGGGDDVVMPEYLKHDPIIRVPLVKQIHNADLFGFFLVSDGVLKPRMPMDQEPELKSEIFSASKGFEKCFDNLSASHDSHKSRDADDRSGFLCWFESDSNYQKSQKSVGASSSVSSSSTGSTSSSGSRKSKSKSSRGPSSSTSSSPSPLPPVPPQQFLPTSSLSLTPIMSSSSLSKKDGRKSSKKSSRK